MMKLRMFAILLKKYVCVCVCIYNHSSQNTVGKKEQEVIDNQLFSQEAVACLVHG